MGEGSCAFFKGATESGLPRILQNRNPGNTYLNTTIALVMARFRNAYEPGNFHTSHLEAYVPDKGANERNPSMMTTKHCVTLARL